MKPKKKPAVVRMLVVVPRLPDLTMAEQRRSVRDTLRQTGDYYGLPVRVRGLAAGVEVYEPGLIPAEFMRQPEPPPATPDKTAIKEALKAGREVPGCTLTTGKRLEIK